jgi:hypothetical protein
VAYLLDRGLGGLYTRSGRYGEVKILGTTETQIPTHSVVQSVSSCYTDCAIVALAKYVATLIRNYLLLYVV